MNQNQPSEELDAAIECLKSAFQIDNVIPDNKLEQLCNGQTTQQNQISSEELKQEANQLMKQQKYQEAIDRYTLAIEINRQNNESQRNLAIYYANRGLAKKNLNQIQNAIEDYNLALQADPTYDKAQQRLEQAQQLLNQNNQQQAQQNNQQQNQGDFNLFGIQQQLQELMKDPEIAQLLSDPANQEKLQQIKQNPMTALSMLNDPALQPIIAKVMAKCGGNLGAMFQGQ